MKPLSTLKQGKRKGGRSMPKKKPILYPVVFMIAITAFFTFLLAFINASTIDIIQKQEDLRLQRSILFVFDIPYDEANDNEVTSIFEDRIDIIQKEDRIIYTYEIDGTTKGYAFQFSGSGLWGTITGHIALAPSFEEIIGVNFIAHSETPGLGGRIDELWYKNQFRGIIPNSSTEAIVYRPASNGNVDAITGATLTSKSVSGMINKFIPVITEYAQEEGLYERN